MLAYRKIQIIYLKVAFSSSWLMSESCIQSHVYFLVGKNSQFSWYQLHHCQTRLCCIWNHANQAGRNERNELGSYSGDFRMDSECCSKGKLWICYQVGTERDFRLPETNSLAFQFPWFLRYRASWQSVLMGIGIAPTRELTQVKCGNHRNFLSRTLRNASESSGSGGV